jgi:uncharacterized protein YndB with AHSA1/START domain
LIAGGGLLTLGSALTRFGIFNAGVASVRDPRYTVQTQRDRAREAGRGWPVPSRAAAGAHGHTVVVAVVNVLVQRPPEQVWAVLADGSSYAEWVVGTREIRGVDEDWPALGSAIQYAVGVGPVRLEGSTTVRSVEPGRRLGLEADGRPFGTARILIELFPWGEDTVVVLDEHPLRGPGYHLHNTLSDAVLLLRGRPMIRNLARLVEKRNPRP